MQELDLISGCQQNNYKAQLRVYEQYKDMLYNTSWRILKNNFDAQDAVHDAFIKGFKNINQLKGEMNLGAWLKRIVVNRSLDIIKKQNKISWLEDMTNTNLIEQNTVHIELDQSVTVTEISRCIDLLKEKYRIVLVLYLIEEYTHREIAESLGMNQNTVRNQYVRGKKQLQEIIKAQLKL